MDLFFGWISVVIIHVLTNIGASASATSLHKCGPLLAITQHGINHIETGALMQSSFEETVEILTEAAAIGERDDQGDDCHSIAEDVMFGQMVFTSECTIDDHLPSDPIPDLRFDKPGLVPEMTFPPST